MANSKSRLPYECKECDNKREWNCRNKYLNLIESVIESGNATEDNRQELEGARDHRGKKISKVAPALGGLYFYECPLGWITAETNIIIQQLTYEENPPLIFQGTWLDQPQWYIEAVQIYNTKKHEWRSQQAVQKA